MHEEFIPVTMIVGTIILYLLMISLYRRFSIPFFLPVLTTSIAIIFLLTSFHFSYSDYMSGGQWLNFFLSPAVVAFAYPLYQQRKLILENALPIIGGVLIGLLTGIFTVLLFAKVLAIPKDLILSMIPKSITTPVAMQMSSEIGGLPALTVAFVMIAGISGAILGPIVLKWVRIHSSLGTGVALGSSSHAIGTTKAYEYGEVSASMSSVAMTLSAIIGPVIAVLITKLL